MSICSQSAGILKPTQSSCQDKIAKKRLRREHGYSSINGPERKGYEANSRKALQKMNEAIVAYASYGLEG
jgi:hypothetical protein